MSDTALGSSNNVLVEQPKTHDIENILLGKEQKPRSLTFPKVKVNVSKGFEPVRK